MKTTIKNLLLLPVLIASLGLISAGRVSAQTFTTLYSFVSSNGSTGINPNAIVLGSDGNFYGTTSQGGTIINNNYPAGMGTVFQLTTNGTLTNLFDFDVDNGLYPYGSLIQGVNGDFYGTTAEGGNGYGSVFMVATNGDLNSFPMSRTGGGNPVAGLTIGTDGNFYGTTEYGTNGTGSVFRFTTNGTFTTIASFIGTNGEDPVAALALGNDGNFYGTTLQGGNTNLNDGSGWGTVFQVTTNGTLTNLVLFNNTNGANPYARLILSGNTIYGTTSGGGKWGDGTVFKLNNDGTHFTNLYNFAGGVNGFNPRGGLTLSGSTLYGEAANGGSSGNGTIFAVNTDGSGFTNLHSFNYTDGSQPQSELILSGNTLFGSTAYGGNENQGTVFSLFLPPPQLTITYSSTNVIMNWANYAPNVTLQSTTNLISPAVWNTNLPPPVLVGGLNTVTNVISGIQAFYRLSQ
jgi:uncharacterized repeat protein (TIGR03803 family)